MFPAILKFSLLLLLLSFHLPFVYAQDLVPFWKNGKYGFANSNLELKIEAQYDDALPFNEDLAIVGKIKQEPNGFKWIKYGYIDKTGKEVIPCQYAYATPFEQGRAYVVALNLKDTSATAFIIDKNQNIIVRGLYANARSRFENHEEFKFMLPSQKEMLLMDTLGNSFICDLQGNNKRILTGYMNIGASNNTINYYYGENTLVSKADDDTWFAIDVSQNKEIIPKGQYNNLRACSEGLFAAQKGDKWGFIDKNNQVIIPFQFDEASNFSNGLALVGKKADKNINDFEALYQVGIINSKGVLIVPFKEMTYYKTFFEKLNFKNGIGVLYVSTNQAIESQLAFLDTKGKYTLLPYYNFFCSPAEVSEGLMPVAQNANAGIGGYIRTDGSLAIPLDYSGLFGIGPCMYLEAFKNGLTRTTKHHNWLDFEFEFYLDSLANEYLEVPQNLVLVQTSSNITVFQKPSKDSRTLTSIPNNTIIKYIEKTNIEATIEQKKGIWLKINTIYEDENQDWQNGEGYIFSGFVNETFYTAKAKFGSKLQAEPNTKSKELAIIKQNEVVFLLEETPKKEVVEGKEGVWLKVAYPHRVYNPNTSEQENRIQIGFVFGGFFGK